MRAAVMRGGKIVADTIPDPVPGDGQVLVKTLACGICGSDLHALRHAEEMSAMARAAGSPFFSMDLQRDVVMGHEFCAEIVEFGPGTARTLEKGDRICSLPIVFHQDGVSGVGYSNDFPGGYGELMVLSEPTLLRVSDGLSTEEAALTEPMAVGTHAVAKANLQPADVPLVVGCGPVGLAVVAALRLGGREPIIAADFSARRRGLAQHLGAHVVVDPNQQGAIEAWSKEAGAGSAVVFECVGVPGLIRQLIFDAPQGARIVVAGVCMEDDRIKPMAAIYKEINIQFVLGYTPEEFTAAFRSLEEGEIDVAPLITGKVGVDEVAGVFESLENPDAHAKVLVEPWR
jgi:2-desacetyl-2-hydroxyethyl bacteriochlorophyllide A dehydrogenase